MDEAPIEHGERLNEEMVPLVPTGARDESF